MTQTHRFSISAWISFGPKVSFRSLSKETCETFSNRMMNDDKYRDTVSFGSDSERLGLYIQYNQQL